MMNNRKIIIAVALVVAAGVLGFGDGVWAADVYVDNTLVADCGSGSYSIASRDCSGSDGNAYSSIQDALDSMSEGDDIYLRGGTYVGRVIIPPDVDGTGDDWCSIQSFPGEWAVIDGNQTGGSSGYALGNDAYNPTRTSYMARYWLFERLEITNSYRWGIFIHGGPVKIRYCYIHNNSGSFCTSNTGGVGGYIWEDSVVEYSWFRDNGCTSSENEMHAVTGIQVFSDYCYSDPEDFISAYDGSQCFLESAMKRNIIQYNLFDNPGNRAKSGIHNKAQQFLTPHTNINWSNKYLGDRIHHNVFINCPRAIGVQQDFAQIYNNIAYNSTNGIHVGDWGIRTGLTAVTIYNNQIFGGHLVSSFGHQNYDYVVNPYIYWYNNIIDSSVDTLWQVDLTLGSGSMRIPFDYDSGRTGISNNYIYRPDNGDDIRVTSNSGGCFSLLGLAEYDSCYSSINYRKASSEGIDNIYRGMSGADQYITRSEHVLGGSATIANGGIGGSHPYLDGVTIPSYVGATNPNDNDWVDGVLSLANVGVLMNGGSGDPSWIEGYNGSDTVPNRSNPFPTGTLPAGTTQTNISLTTDKQAICRYTNISGTNYTNMPFNFTYTNSTNHSTLVTDLENGKTYAFYVRCNSSDGYVNDDDWNITFSIDGHKADINDDGLIDMRELIGFIGRWKANDGVTKAEVWEARDIWFTGGIYP
ncbi:MAG: hypothetical protein U9M95_00100 [Candidatus Altiarchaeota archaeon]|nr:hypothetical protein [Candidatus Altiarchaeota archaeon]